VISDYFSSRKHSNAGLQNWWKSTKHNFHNRSASLFWFMNTNKMMYLSVCGQSEITLGLLLFAVLKFSGIHLQSIPFGKKSVHYRAEMWPKWELCVTGPDEESSISSTASTDGLLRRTAT
jgi:hypothetical protein